MKGFAPHILVALLSIAVGVVGCNVLDPGGQQAECSVSAECDGEDVCVDGRCVECATDDDCDGDSVCSNTECVSGCSVQDCGPGGSCVDDGGAIRCECEIDAYRQGGICHLCDCDVANGQGECDEQGNCSIFACDDGYYTEDDDPSTGCECGPVDRPDPETFRDANCDGLDGDASIAVFVSPFGDDEHDGIRTRPVRTINRGIELALDDDGRSEVYIAEGEYNEVIRLNEAVGLYGGYFDAGLGDWERSHNHETIITGVGLPGGHRPIEIAGIEGDMALQLLTIRADDTPLFGSALSNTGSPQNASSVGVTLLDNAGHVAISYVTIETGDGRDGVDAGPSAEGDPGEDGGEGYGPFDDDYPAAPGEPTPQVCPLTGAPANLGGPGGHGGNPHEDEWPEPGLDGTGPHGGSGGAEGVREVSDAICGPAQDRVLPEDGDPASAPGSPGAHGAPTPQIVQLGVHLENILVYAVPRAGAGEIGQPGSGGGGGGAGAGIASELCISGCSCLEIGGGGGGAGGNGGCGGEGGAPGEWGGGAFAIMASGSSLSVYNSDLRPGSGGQGGTGAVGGPGGSGGDGGDGFDNDNPDFPDYDGGDGGDGSTGGQGGGGAGGLGGPSIGIIHFDSHLSTGDLVFEPGEPGSGGSGGGSDNDGHQGLVVDVYEADSLVDNIDAGD